MSQKQVMPKSEDLSRSLEINAIWTFDTEFPTIFIKSCTYITFTHKNIAARIIHNFKSREYSFTNTKFNNTSPVLIFTQCYAFCMFL